MHSPTFRTPKAFLIRSLVPLLLSLSSLKAAEWYVDASAGGANNGTSWANAWTSFAAINQGSLSSDDIVWINSGTYDERFSVSQSGTDGHRIKYIGTGPSRPVLRGINGGSADYIAIINLEIAQLSTSNNYSAIQMGGCVGWLIQDNYIHDTYQNGVNTSSTSENSYNIIRHNTFADIGSIDGGNGGGSNPTVVNIVGNYNLIEYNTVIHSMDRTRAFGTGNVVRNNYWGYTDTTLYPNSPQYPSHTDGFQGFEGRLPIIQLMYERNYDVDNTDTIGGTNAHSFLIQDTVGPNGFTWVTIRFNQWIRPGGSAYAFQNVSRTYVFNNTFIQINRGSSSLYNNGATYTYPSSYTVETSRYADVRNNTWSFSPRIIDGSGVISSNYLPLDFTSAAQHSFNLGVQAKLPTGASPANLPQVDPLFVDGTGEPGHDDYRLQSGSPLRGAGAALTTAVGSGSNSTTLVVADARRLFDGWGIADADYIKIGSSAYVQIASIDYPGNTVTLSEARTWSDGAGVYIKGTEDVGALPYDYAGSFTVTNTSPALVAGNNTLSATVDVPDAVRMVEFLVDGLPVGIDYTAPYSTSYSSDGNAHDVVARAYALWASATLTVEDGGPTAPVAPSDATLIISP